MILDFHTHAFPDKIAQKAMDSLSFASGGVRPRTDGTAEGLRQHMKENGVDAYVVLSIATNPKQMQKVNDFAASLKADNVFPFGSVHPDAPDALDELQRIKELGLRGIKLHPEYQQFYVDDEKMKPIYKEISRLGLAVTFHAGFDPGFIAPFHATPERIARAMKWLDTDVIAAHWGSLGMEEEVRKYLFGLPIYLDMAHGSSCITRMGAERCVREHGVDKILFASDTPWHSPYQELDLLCTLGLSESEKQAILWDNGMRILNK